MVANPSATSITASPANQPAAAPLPALWRDGYFWLTLALTIFAIAPFALPGYAWSANDARHHVYFLFEYNRAVQDGIWWPRWCPDFTFGYGYPFFNIYGILSHFLAELFLYFLNFSYTGAIEAVFVLGILASAATMYLFVRGWLGRPAALVAALVYTYLPYHLLNLYVRANLAESSAFVWMPLCLWAVYGATASPAGGTNVVDWRKRFGWLCAVAVSYAGLMLTSNLVTVLFTPVLLLYLFLRLVLATRRTSSGRRFLPLTQQFVISALVPGIGLLAGLGLSANFWIPAFLERQYVDNAQWFDGRYDFRPNFVYAYQLFSPHWGFGVSQAGPDDAISFQIGVAALALAVIGVISTWRHLRNQRAEISFLVVAGLISILISLQIAAPLWELPLLGAILRTAQFPWRWFSILALCISPLAGLVLVDTEQNPPPGARTPVSGNLLATLGLAALIILASYPLLRVQISEPVEGPVGLASMMRFQRSSDEMTGRTLWASQPVSWSDIADTYLAWEQQGKPVEPVTTTLDYNFDYQTLGAGRVANNTIMEEVFYQNNTEREQPLIFNRFYYPGWNAYLLDGEHGTPLRPLTIEPATTDIPGRITILTPPGSGFILLRFEETAPRRIGRLISLGTLSLLMLLVLFLYARLLVGRISGATSHVYS